MKTKITAFVSGIVFAIGLGLAGMTQPSKVIGFLDFTGAWDPSLAFVMMGAIGVHAFFAWRVSTMRAPLFAEKFNVPMSRKLDGPLVAGAAVFGIGWGLAGYCPGPALVAATSFAPATLVFVAGMLGGMFVMRRARPRAAPEAAPPA